MRLVHALLAPPILLLCPPLALAWPALVGGRSGGNRGEGGAANTASRASPPPEEHRTSLLEATLDHLSSNPSCFLRALSFLPSPLSSPSSSSASAPSASAPCDALSRSDAARVELAARLALCEIRTTGSSFSREAGDDADEGERRAEGAKVPRECEDWEGGKRGSKVGGCVEALSRSPQYWSSYSGYLREIGASPSPLSLSLCSNLPSFPSPPPLRRAPAVTLCSTLSRWSDLAHARSLYREAAELVRAWGEEVRGFEAAKGRAEEEREGRSRGAEEDLATALSSLSALHHSFTTTSSSLSSSLDSTASSLALLAVELGTQLERIEMGMKGAVESVRGELEGLVKGAGEELRGSLQAHDASLSAIAASTGDRLASALDLLDAKQAFLVERVIDLSTSVQTVDASLKTVHTVLLDLQPLSESLSLSLTGSLSAASLLEVRSFLRTFRSARSPNLISLLVYGFVYLLASSSLSSRLRRRRNVRRPHRILFRLFTFPFSSHLLTIPAPFLLRVPVSHLRGLLPPTSAAAAVGIGASAGAVMARNEREDGEEQADEDDEDDELERWRSSRRGRFARAQSAPL
ncbi:hypothetical protein JCM6882_006578 [Rhodosporidiobolus microsporus]